MLVVYVGKPKFEPDKLLSYLLVTFSIVDNRSVRKTPHFGHLRTEECELTLISILLSIPPFNTNHQKDRVCMGTWKSDP